MGRIRLTLSEIDGYVRSEIFDENKQGTAYSDTVRMLRDSLLENATSKQRSYILMYYKKQMTMDEIALTCGVAKSTVSRTIARGRRNIIKGMKSEELRKLIEHIKGF